MVNNMESKYWDEYYKKHGKDNGISINSSFAEFCQKNYFDGKELSVVELGSGNGRDAIYFAHKGHKVHALDQSTVAIEIEMKQIHKNVGDQIFPKAVDFIRENYSEYDAIDVFYSRFTLHAISKQDEEIILPKVYDALRDGGLFCIEVRTTKDELFGQGESKGENAYVTDHYRRFIDTEKFLPRMKEMGYKVLYFLESDNLSVYKNDNPVLMRLILQK